MDNISLLLRCALIIPIGLTAIPPAAFGNANVAALDQAASTEGTGEVGLEEIIVTARRRAESLQTVPVAVSAISGDALTAANAVDATDHVFFR